MRGLFLEEGRVTLRDDLPLPQRETGEALLRIALAGICNTDLELLRGYYPFRGIPGHEFVGTVVESDDPGWVGQRVVGDINVTCGKCDMCRRGMAAHCRSRLAVGIHGCDGAMAEYMTLPASNLHRVPDAVEDEAAVFTEPLAAALEILEGVHIKPSDLVVVLGDGKLGLLVAQAIALSGCRLIAIGHHPEKLAILERRAIRTQADGAALWKLADVVIECTGSQSGFEDALRLIRPRGQIVLKSTYAGQATVDMSRVVVDEVHLVGSRCGPFEPALQMLARGLVDVKSLIDSTYTLDDGVSAFQRAGKRGSLKVLVRP